MRIILLSLLTVALFISCKKNEQDTHFWECHNAQNLDSAAIHAKLIGSWKWTKSIRGWGGGTHAADKNIKVVFTTNNFTVTEDNTVLTQGTWSMYESGSSWKLSLSTSSSYLYGDILFCSGQVEFDDRATDGDANFFTLSN